MPQLGNSVSLQITKIQEIVFIIDERLLNNEQKEIKIDFQHKIQFDMKEKVIVFTLRTFYHENDISKAIVESQIRNYFETPNNIADYLEGDKLILPFNACVTMVSMAIGHARALISKNLSGSLLQDNLIPILNPFDVSKAFFPESFAREMEYFDQNIKAKLVEQIGTNKGFSEILKQSNQEKRKKVKSKKASR